MNRKLVIRALAATVVLRMFYSGAAFLFSRAYVPNAARAASNELTEHLLGPQDGWRYAILGSWERFDTLWYLLIAGHGYDRPAATVFYPLYPFLIRVLSWMHFDPLVAGLLISTAASFFLFWGIQKLGALDSPGDPSCGLQLAVLWPASFIFFAAYPDSLVIALIIWSVYQARKERWWWAAIFAMLAGLTKAVGVLACVPLAVLLIRKRRWKELPALAIACSGFAAYALWIKLSGFPPSAVTYATYWHTTMAWPWTTLTASIRESLRGGPALLTLNLLLFLFFLAVTLVGLRRLEFALFSFAALAMFLTKRTDPLLQSTMRYVLLIFPVFLSLGRYCQKPAARFAILVIACGLNLVLLRAFFEWSLAV